VERRDVSGMSFVFQVMPRGDRFERRDGMPVRIISDMVIQDISIVTYPAYTATDVQVAQRSLQAFKAQRGHRIDWLRRRSAVET
jgi:phage head maturation protease